MADPLLTSLCAICHVSPPKYKCPRCSIQTCSLPCIKKHKAWSECTGERDATAYVVRSKLRTPAGIDHDYNFLHGIELKVERKEKLLVEEKALVQEGELRPLTVQEVKWKPGRDGRKRKVLVTRVLREAKGRVFEKMLGQRLKRLNVGVLCAPMGMKRQRENNTTFNRRTGRINWQVEWLTFDTEVVTDGDEDDEDDEDNEDVNTTRVLAKVMDDVPLYQAYHTSLEDEQRAAGQLPKKTPRNVEDQSSADSTWLEGPYSLQDPSTGRWSLHKGPHLNMWPAEKDDTERTRFQFYLARPKTRSDLPAMLTKLEATDCLRDILTNTRVLEFPALYVLPKEASLPPGFVLGPKDTVPSQGTKRKLQGGKKMTGKGPKRRRQNGKDLEEGEVNSDEDGAASGPDEKGAVGLEAGDVIAEQSLGEDDDSDEDDETSSSGTSSDDE